jgi:hypothetical protein
MVNKFLQRHRFLRRALFLVGVFFCFRALMLEPTATRQYQQVAKWPFAQALISSSSVYTTSYSWSGKSLRSCPMLGYVYNVEGRTYNGYNRVFDFVCWSDANDYVARHQPGASDKIAYDPADPAVSIVPDAVRDPGYPWGDGHLCSNFAHRRILGMDDRERTRLSRIRTQQLKRSSTDAPNKGLAYRASPGFGRCPVQDISSNGADSQTGDREK